MPCYSVLKRLIVFEQGTPTSQPESGPASVVTSSASARSPGSSARYEDCCDAAGPSPGMTQTFRQPSTPATDLASPLHWTAPCPARFHSLRALPFPSHGHPSLLPSARLPPPPPLSLAVSARISASSPPAVSRCSPPSPRAVTQRRPHPLLACCLFLLPPFAPRASSSRPAAVGGREPVRGAILAMPRRACGDDQLTGHFPRVQRGCQNVSALQRSLTDTKWVNVSSSQV